jgi:hypothetical protein
MGRVLNVGLYGKKSNDVILYSYCRKQPHIAVTTALLSREVLYFFVDFLFLCTPDMILRVPHAQ